MNNIFSNDCTSGEYYKQNKIKYNHPFVWVHFPVNEYFNFILNYNIINFLNFKIYPIDGNIQFKNMSAFNRNKYISYYIEVDNIFKIAFSHYLKNEKEGKGLVNVYSPNIKDYIIEKYKERINRFNKDNKIVFLFNEKRYTTKEDIINFININVNYQKIIYTSYQELLKYNSNMIKIIYEKNIDYSTSFKNFAKILNNFISEKD